MDETAWPKVWHIDDDGSITNSIFTQPVIINMGKNAEIYGNTFHAEVTLNGEPLPSTSVMKPQGQLTA